MLNIRIMSLESDTQNYMNDMKRLTEKISDEVVRLANEIRINFEAS